MCRAGMDSTGFRLWPRLSRGSWGQRLNCAPRTLGCGLDEELGLCRGGGHSELTGTGGPHPTCLGPGEKQGVPDSDPGRRKRACRREDQGDSLGRMPSRAPSGQPHPGSGLQPVRTQLRGPGTPAPRAGLCLGLASLGRTHLCALLLRLSSSGSQTFSDREREFPTS